MSVPTAPVRSVTDGGLETDLIFHHGVDLPDFAAFVLVDDDDGLRTLREYYRGYVEIARVHHAPLRLETPTWRASADWGARLGYDAEALRRVDIAAVRLLQQIAAESGLPAVRIVGMLGPRGDGYRSGAWDPVTGPDDAYRYHLNCAHPDHFARAIDEETASRLIGIRPNASRLSHAELDESETLDDGDPEELATRVAELLERMPSVRVIGGCCGTDSRHIAAIWERLAQ